LLFFLSIQIMIDNSSVKVGEWAFLVLWLQAQPN
jgi:hypothetical protein